MSRRVDHADRDGSDVEHVPVVERVERELGLGRGMHRHRNVVLQGEPAVARHVIRVRVRLEHARDSKPMFFGRLEVGLDRVRGIHEKRLAVSGVADEV